MTRATVFLLIRLLIAVAAGALFLVIAQQIRGETDLTALDQQIAQNMATAHNQMPLVSVVFFGLTLLAALQTMFVLVPLGAILLLSVKQRRAALVFLLCGIVAGLSNSNLKHYYERPRPAKELRYGSVWENNESFPSGHASASMAVFGLLGYFAWRHNPSARRRFWIVTGFGLLILGIGFSRIFLCAHYFSDVVGGYLLGLVCLMIWISLAALLGERGASTPR